MKDYIELGTTPCSENCVGIGSDDYRKQSKIEANTFAKQLIRNFGQGTLNNYFEFKSFPHDFGTYFELVIHYNDEDEESLEYALKLEGNLPEVWDEKSIEELQKLGYNFKGGK